MYYLHGIQKLQLHEAADCSFFPYPMFEYGSFLLYK